jgi:hypothetical protein
MSDTKTRTGQSTSPAYATSAGQPAPTSRVDFWIFVLMLVLAIGGVAVSQAFDSGGRLYWLGLVVVYAAIGITRSYLNAAGRSLPPWPMIRAQVLHWVGALVAINIVLWFESSGIADRAPAADSALLILALSCYLAGVHFDWTFMLLGGILAVIAVGLGYLDQISIFLVTIPLAVLAIWIVYQRKFAASR